MQYTLLALNGAKNCDALSKEITDVLNSHNCSLQVDDVYLNKFELNLSGIVEHSKRAHAVAFPITLSHLTPPQRKIKDNICKENNLYARASRYIANNDEFDFYIVSDGNGGMLEGGSGFRTNSAFGREAYCEESYSELEIERVARAAYEIAERTHKRIDLVDLDPRLATSQLWYKILTDINEDYPSVLVGTRSFENAIDTLVNSPNELEILIAPRIVAKALNATAAARRDSDFYSCYSGDTTLALYVFQSPAKDKALSALASDMVEHSLGGFN